MDQTETLLAEIYRLPTFVLSHGAGLASRYRNRNSGTAVFAAMNFYASRDFLDAAASVYFPDRDTSVEDVRIDDEVLRLLVVDGSKPVTRLLFLDYHQPLRADEIGRNVRAGRFAQRVGRRMVDLDAWDQKGRPDDALAPLIDWTPFRQFGDYRERLLQRSHGLVRDRERRARGLASRHGRLEFTLDDRAADVLPLARKWKGEQLQKNGQPDFFDDPRTMQFFEELRDRDLLVCSTLRAAGRLVSLWVGFIHEQSWSGWIFAYDPELRSFSPGHQLVTRMLEASHRQGHREFDFSVGAQDYKLVYATHGRVLENVGTPSLARAAMLTARDTLRDHSSVLFAAALRAKWTLNAAIQRAPTLSAAMGQR
jgi:CelD/BcsL family acetyltransferase involved in cellulose biosynthesis